MDNESCNMAHELVLETQETVRLLERLRDAILAKAKPIQVKRKPAKVTVIPARLEILTAMPLAKSG